MLPETIGTVRHLTSIRLSLVAIVLAAVLVLPSLSGGAPTSSEGLPAYFDPAEGGTPLDLFGVRFGQTIDTDLTLIIRTHGAWDPALINPLYGRTLCISLRSDAQPNTEGRLCAYPSPSARSGLSLRYTTLDQNGVQRGIRDLSTVVARPNTSTLRVTFAPSLLGLKPGLYHWSARSQYRDESGCPAPAGCEDTLPNAGENALTVGAGAAPVLRQRCFGAASRDTRRPCSNPRLARAVVPTPDEAVIGQNLPCTPLAQIGFILPCEFGVPAAAATSTIALIGDSHAAHWRAALEYASQEFKWRGVSITRSGCPLTKATPRLTPALRRSQCLQWNQQVPRWLANNPQVSTVFVVAHVESSVVVARGRSQYQAKMNGYAQAWRGLPPSVKRIVVIRDSPRSASRTFSCVRRAIARRNQAGLACARSRKHALSRDPAASAASRMRSPRVKSIDMTSYFCNRRKCFPVIGGALVYKDLTHLTDVFVSSLGPYIVRKISALDG